MAKVLFVDDRLDEVIRQWELTGCSSDHELLSLEPFESIERTCQLTTALGPDIIIIGYGLGKPGITGADVIRSLHERGYAGHIVANSGGGVEQFIRAGVEVDGTADRDPHILMSVVRDLTGDT
ncbi:MAG TPA: hypothetical protein VJJ24_03135 [Candidatus Paceibacterota bacterium]